VRKKVTYAHKQDEAQIPTPVCSILCSTKMQWILISTECVATHGRPPYSDHTNNSQCKFPKKHSIEQMAGTRLDKEFFPIDRVII
jgi:hypothetical protein